MWSWLWLTQHVDYCCTGDLEVTGDFIMCFENRISAWARGSNIHKNSLLNSEVFINSIYPSGSPQGGFEDEGSNCEVSGDRKSKLCRLAVQKCWGSSWPALQGDRQLLRCCHQPWRRDILSPAVITPMTSKARDNNFCLEWLRKWGIIISYDGHTS